MAAPQHHLGDLRGARVLVYSLGKEGQDLASWLVAQGASVTMSDSRSEAALEAAGAVAPPGVSSVVTGRLLPAAGFDLLAVSQSVLRHSPEVAAAQAAGVPVVSQAQLFLELCPGRVVGITGSNGKSMTTALLAAIAEAAGIEHIMGGNIGSPLLGRLADITPATTVILEISHTQLQYIRRGPAVACVLNVTANHLDQFDWDGYVALKRGIVERQGPGDIAVLNADDPVAATFADIVRGQLAWGSTNRAIEGTGAWVEAGSIVARTSSGDVREVVAVADVALRGRHNLANAVMAGAVAVAAGWDSGAIATALRSFPGLRHRLEPIGRALGATWVNDSIATSPERAVAALRSYSEPVILLLGGRHKNVPIDELVAVATDRCRVVVCFGAAAPLFAGALTEAGVPVVRCTTLDEAVAAAAHEVQPGDVVLLAPAAASFDAFPHFEARGDRFAELVRQLPAFEAG